MRAVLHKLRRLFRQLKIKKISESHATVGRATRRVGISSFCLRALKPSPAHHVGQATRSREFAADAAASTVWCFEAPVAFHHFPSCPAHRRPRGAHRLDLETKTLATRRALFFPSRRAGSALVPPVR